MGGIIGMSPQEVDRAAQQMSPVDNSLRCLLSCMPGRPDFDTGSASAQTGDSATNSEPPDQLARKLPLVLVAGATGRQGGSVCQHLLARGTFRVRAMSRNPNSPKAHFLRDCGAEVVFGDLENQESLSVAMRDAYGVFSAQLYGDGVSWEQGIEQGKRLVAVAKSLGVKHFVYSTLDDATEGSVSQASNANPEARAIVERYAITQGLSVTIINPSFYYENVLDPWHWRITADGVYVISLPMGQRPFYMFSVDDLGGIVAKVFERPDEYVGKAIGVAGDFLSGPQLVRVFMNVTGKAARYEEITYESLRTSGIPGASEKADIFRFFEEFPVQRDIVASRMIYPQLMTWRKWLRKSGYQGPTKDEILRAKSG
eukprot:tig00020660_g12530.t1